MKKLYFIFMFAFVTQMASAQDCFWLKGATGGGTAADYGRGVTVDKDGNVYATGNFEGSTLKFGTTTLTNSQVGSNYGGVFIAKYRPSGAFVWAKGSDAGQSNCVTTDKAGNVYIAGSFNVNGITFGTHTLTSIGFEDIFLVKYDSLGNVVWAKSAGGTSNADWASSITSDESGNIIMSGSFYSSSLSIGTYTFTNHGTSSPDAFIAKYDSNGNVLWAKSTGGSNNDNGLGVASDKSKSVYFSGVFDSDSLTFGSTTIHKPAGGAIFIAKYDSAGNFIRVKNIHTGFYASNGSVCQIASDTLANLFVSGEYAGTSLIIGNDTLPNPSGNTRIFIAKFDSSGNPMWARGAALSNYTYNINNGLAIDKTGSALITGYFEDTGITFGTFTLNNQHPGNPAIYIAKYDAAGVVQWAKTSTSTGSNVYGYGMAAGIGENAYVIGNYTSLTLAFGNASLSNMGTSDFFLTDVYSFSSGITSYTNVTCNGGHSGTIIANASGGNMPYNYSWSISPVHIGDTATSFPSNGNTATNLPAGYYSITITEGYGCSQTSNVTLTEPVADSLHICMVTVDSASQHNIIIWDKTSFTNIDSFIVCREIATNNYQPIASIPFDSLSQYIDTTRTRYFPNTGDPNAGTYRYKLKAHEVCGGYTGLSPFHNTIYILNNAGTFYWTQPYTIQGGANPVSSYVLMRDDNSTGSWHSVSSVAGTQQTISDPLYSIYQNTARWRVQTNWSITCTPTARVANGAQSNFSTSLSNVYSNNTTAITANSVSAGINIYPNPSNGKFNLEYSSLEKGKNSGIEVYNMIGKKVYTQNDLAGNQTIIDLSSLSAGVYFLHLKTEAGTTVKRIVIQ